MHLLGFGCGAGLPSRYSIGRSLTTSRLVVRVHCAASMSTVQQAYRVVTHRRRETQPQQSHMQRAMPKWQICSCPKQADPTLAGTQALLSPGRPLRHPPGPPSSLRRPSPPSLMQAPCTTKAPPLSLPGRHRPGPAQLKPGLVVCHTQLSTLLLPLLPSSPLQGLFLRQ